MYMVKIQKFCNNNDDNLNKKRQYCIMYTTFDERRVGDVLWSYYYNTGLQKKTLANSICSLNVAIPM